MQDEKQQGVADDTSHNSGQVLEKNGTTIAHVENYRTALGEIKPAFDKNVVSAIHANTRKINEQPKAVALQLSVPNDAMKGLRQAIGGQMAILEKPEMKDALNKLATKQIPVLPRLEPSAHLDKFSSTDPTSPITTVLILGQMIRRSRESRKLNQQEFADLAGVGRRFLSELENGKSTVEFGKVLQVAKAAGLDLFAKVR